MERLLLAVVCGLIAGYLYVRWRYRPRTVVHAEYWVYLPGDQMPSQERLMDRIVRNPFAAADRNPIGTPEALVMSDVRLHIALVRRDKNPFCFRPDFFAGRSQPTEGQSAAVGGAQSFVKLRFYAEEPVSRRSYLQFLPYAAEAAAELGGGGPVYDPISERIWDSSELAEVLAKDPDATRPDLHLNVLWREDARGIRLETRGLKKIGQSELRSEPLPEDEKRLAEAAMLGAATTIWTSGEVPEETELDWYGDRLHVRFGAATKQGRPVRILRERRA